MKGEPSRIDNSPATASTSPLVRITPAIGLCLSCPALGCSCGVAITCWRRSGEALIRYQCTPSTLTAIEAWVLRSSGCSLRAFRHTAHPQFHCGIPPPAAAPRTTTRSMTVSWRFSLKHKLNYKRLTRASTTNAARWTPASDTFPLSGTCPTRKSTCVRYEMRYRLLAGGAHIHVDFHADRNFDDFWCFPGHSDLPLIPGELRPCRSRYCGSKSSPVKSFAWNSICLCCAAKGFSRSCAEGLGQNNVGSSISRLFAPLRMAILGATGRCRLRIKKRMR